jgi:hypothetical protein
VTCAAYCCAMLRRWIAGLALAGVFLASRSAGATEKEHHLGADLGLSLLSIQDKSTVDFGGGIGAHYAYGLSDQFNFLAELNGSIVALGSQGDAMTPRTRPSTLSTAAVGLAYVLDITQWVPYFGVLAGAGMMTGGTVDSPLFLPDGVIALGLDYRVNHDWSLGVAARQHMFVTRLGDYPSYTTLNARLEYTWGW